MEHDDWSDQEVPESCGAWEAIKLIGIVIFFVLLVIAGVRA